jgi:predicted RNA-binding protein Jag
VRDPVFAGGDVAAAVGAAAEALGLPVEQVRYVVLQQGVPARGSSPGQQAQIAVVLEERGGHSDPTDAAPSGSAELESRLQEVAGALRRVAGWEISVRIEDGGGAPVALVEGPAEAQTLEVLRALEHILRRAAGVHGPAELHVRSEAFRAQRDEALRRTALDAAAEVRRDGTPRTVDCRNSYERRIVHMALAGEAGVRTRSEGEGEARRLLVETATPVQP